MILGVVIALATMICLALLAGSAWLLFYGSEGACEENPALERMEQIAAAAPAAANGATVVAERSGAECRDDSGDPWMTADTVYAHDGDAPPLITHYWDTAAKEGWKAGGTRNEAPDRFRNVDGICFRKDIAGEPALLRVRSLGADELMVSVESALDGSKMPC
ncbi:hypothetical protein [Streptomyces sp. NBC_01310]|uniref:hypothetical protein n=1 Tax=Streptomyces sp. NBC_01310 TaxID=2903820 RepID=UPI003F4AF846